jgi:hypothetical protein
LLRSTGLPWRKAGERALDTDGISRKFLASATLVIPRDNAEAL